MPPYNPGPVVVALQALKQSLKLGDSTLIAQAYGDVSSVYLKKGDYDTFE